MTIRTLFSTRRPIDRPIEKVIDYYATDENRLRAEIEEYEVTDNVEACFRRFLDVYDTGVATGQVTEIGVWVAGFYGAGKSSFTKYLGFALDADRAVSGRPFLDFLCERITSVPLRANLKTIATKHPSAVVLLDLGSEQLADTTIASVTTVLYWKVLQYAGYSKEKKLAELELKFEELGVFEQFREAYRAKFGGEWEEIHNSGMTGVARAAQLIPSFLPGDFPTPESFRQLKFEEATDVRDRARRMIELVRRKSGKQNIIFLIDEAGQYVAPRGDLILNLDGLARNFKELGQGRVWIMATGQQTLAEIVEKAAYNSAELNKLRDRFPIPINLEPSDIREITYRRLLSKSPDGDRRLKADFGRQGQALVNFTRLTGTSLFKGDPDADTFAKLYPFLPQHFDLLLELIRRLAAGAMGLRSAIKVIQDLLVDASKVLPADAVKLADKPIGSLACVDNFYDTLRADIAKVLPHVTRGVERVATAFPGDALALRVAKAIAALQPIENFPRTPENIAALLYPALGAPTLLDDVREVLRKLVGDKECGVVDDPQAGGFLFLSEGVKPLRDKRNSHVPGSFEMNQVRAKLLADMFDPAPSARLENVKEVKAGIRYGKNAVLGEDADIQFRIEAVDPASFEERRMALLSETNALPALKNSIAWLVKSSAEAEDLIAETCKSEWVAATPEREADKDVAQFLRAERRAAQDRRDRASKLLKAALLEGTFIFQGRPTPAKEAAATIDAAARKVLTKAAEEIFPYLRLVPIRPSTDLAAKFLGVERLDRMPRELDPLGLVVTRGGGPRVDVNNAALAETLRAFQQRLDESGGRLQGNFLQDFFAGPPYGWSKDATRYLFAALLIAGEIRLFTTGGEVSTSGPSAQEALKSTVAFNRVGVSRRDARPSLEALDRAATRLQEMFGVEVLPLEDHISKTVRTQVPGLIDKIAALPDRLRLLGLPGEERARRLIETATDLKEQDAAAAAGILGGPQCNVPADVRWAREVNDALANGAESEVRLARSLERDLDEVAGMFPSSGAAIVTSADEAAIRETLASESFYEKLPALRAAVRSTLDRVRARYAERRAGFASAVQSARSRLEAMPEWLLVSAEDRDEIIRRLDGSEFPTAPEQNREVAQLRLLLAREAGLNSALTRLEAEVRRRVPAPPTVPVPEPPAEEAEVDVADLPTPDVIRTRADLDAWLASLREQLVDLLRQNKAIRFRKIPKGAVSAKNQ
jgi:hypothetical protein